MDNLRVNRHLFHLVFLQVSQLVNPHLNQLDYRPVNLQVSPHLYLPVFLLTNRPKSQLLPVQLPLEIPTCQQVLILLHLQRDSLT